MNNVKILLLQIKMNDYFMIIKYFRAILEI